MGEKPREHLEESLKRTLKKTLERGLGKNQRVPWRSPRESFGEILDGIGKPKDTVSLRINLEKTREETPEQTLDRT